MTVIQTYTGKRIDILSVDPSKIDPVDIAWSLSGIPRFNRHLRKDYYVAQHCLLCASIAPESVKLEALLHDASEYIIGDLSSPLKRAIDSMAPGVVKKIEGGVHSAIALRFGLVYPYPAPVKDIDIRMLATERRDLMTSSPDINIAEWWGEGGEIHEPYPFGINVLTKEECFERFLSVFSYLYDQRMLAARREKKNAHQSGAVFH